MYVSGEAGNENRCILKMAIIAFFLVLGKTILEMSELGLDHDPLLFLSILGSALPGMLASLDTTGLAEAFLGIA